MPFESVVTVLSHFAGGVAVVSDDLDGFQIFETVEEMPSTRSNSTNAIIDSV